MLMPVESALFNPLVCYLAAYLSFASTLQPSCHFHCQQYLPMASWHPASHSSASEFAVQLSAQGPGHPAVVFSAI